MAKKSDKKRSALSPPRSPVRKRSKGRIKLLDQPNQSISALLALESSNNPQESSTAPPATPNEAQPKAPLRDRYKQAVQRIENHLCHPSLTLQILKDAQNPLRTFHKYLANVRKC